VVQDTAKDAGPKVADLLAALVVHPDRDAAVGATVLFQDDHLLGDVDETTGQVAGVRGAESRVGQTLSGAVRGDEVLEHGEALTAVGTDRLRDDITLRVGDEAATPG